MTRPIVPAYILLPVPNEFLSVYFFELFLFHIHDFPLLTRRLYCNVWRVSFLCIFTSHSWNSNECLSESLFLFYLLLPPPSSALPSSACGRDLQLNRPDIDQPLWEEVLHSAQELCQVFFVLIIFFINMYTLSTHPLRFPHSRLGLMVGFVCLWFPWQS